MIPTVINKIGKEQKSKPLSLSLVLGWCFLWPVEGHTGQIYSKKKRKCFKTFAILPTVYNTGTRFTLVFGPRKGKRQKKVFPFFTGSAAGKKQNKNEMGSSVYENNTKTIRDYFILPFCIVFFCKPTPPQF